MCEVEAQNVKIGRKEDRYFRCDCEVVLSFGGPELTAQICWEDKGTEKFGPATIIYEA